MQQQPPTDKPDLPSFLCPEYREQQPKWELVGDLFEGLWAWYQPGQKANALDPKAMIYLPQEHKEPGDAYKSRLARSPFDSRFKPAVTGFAGLLADFKPSDDIPPSLAASIDNVDLHGNSLQAFLYKLDIWALTYGHCFCLVEFPPLPAEGIATRFDELNAGRRPWLVAIDPRDVLNWEIEYEAGAPIVQQVTIRERHWVKAGRFGAVEECRYRVLYPGGFEVYRLVQNGQNWVAELLEEGTTTLGTVPLVCYSATTLAPFCSEPPLINIAELNLKLYQLESDYYEVMHRCNLPTPVRVGARFDDGALVLGPNNFIELPEGGNFFFAEPSGAAIGATRTAIEDLKADINDKALDFMGSGDDAAKTATEVAARSSQTRATLQTMAGNKESATQQIFAYWAMWMQEPPTGSIQVNREILSPPPVAADVISAFTAKLLTRRTAIAAMGIAPDPDKEAKLIEAQEEDAAEDMAEAATPEPPEGEGPGNSEDEGDTSETVSEVMDEED